MMLLLISLIFFVTSYLQCWLTLLTLLPINVISLMLFLTSVHRTENYNL